MPRETGKRRADAEESLGQSARELLAALRSLLRAHQLRDRQRICCRDLSVSEFYALRVLIAEGEVTLNHLAQELGLDKSTTSRIVDALEERKHVRRGGNPTDRRALRLQVTAGGRRAHDLVEQDSVRETMCLLEDFDPDVRQAIVLFVGRLARASCGPAPNSQKEK